MEIISTPDQNSENRFPFKFNSLYIYIYIQTHNDNDRNIFRGHLFIHGSIKLENKINNKNKIK